MKIISRQVIRPDQPGPSIRCGIKDVLTPVPASLGFVYERAIDPALLSESLAQALRLYPLFAGSLRKAGREVFLDCDARGVELEVVRHDQPLERWMPATFGSKKPEFVRKVAFGIKPRSTLCHVRVNQFSNDRTVLGICFNHAVGDGQTFGQFFKAWSELAAGLPVEPPEIPLDRQAYALERTPDGAVPSELRRLSALELAQTLGYVLRNTLSSELVMFHFDAAELTNLHRELQARAPVRITNNDALASHMMDIFRSVAPAPRQRDLLVALNGRRRSGLSNKLLGNYVTMMATPFDDDLAPEQLATQLRHAVAAWAPNYHSLHRFVAETGGIGKSFQMAPSGLRRLSGSVFLSNMAGFGLYDIPFADAKPIYIMPLASQFPWFGHTLDSYRGDGVQFHIYAPRAIARQLRAPATLEKLHRYRSDPSSTQASWLL